jgi:hypothetical protein
MPEEATMLYVLMILFCALVMGAVAVAVVALASRKPAPATLSAAEAFVVAHATPEWRMRFQAQAQTPLWATEARSCPVHRSVYCLCPKAPLSNS